MGSEKYLLLRICSTKGVQKIREKALLYSVYQDVVVLSLLNRQDVVL
jgi:hypothetical protein